MSCRREERQQVAFYPQVHRPFGTATTFFVNNMTPLRSTNALQILMSPRNFLLFDVSLNTDVLFNVT